MLKYMFAGGSDFRREKVPGRTPVNWDRMATSGQEQTVFQCWWDNLKMQIWGDDIRLATQTMKPLPNCSSGYNLPGVCRQPKYA